MKLSREASTLSDPAPTVALDHDDGASAPLHDPLDLSCMVDSAYSMADWSMAPSSIATASYSPSVPASGGGARLDDHDGSATLAALDSMYTALSSLGFQQDSQPENKASPLRDSLTYSGAPGRTESLRSEPAAGRYSATGGSHMHEHSHSSPATLHQHVAAAFAPQDMGGGYAAFDNAPPQSQQGMAAAQNAVLEMQRQGLSFQNIQDLVQNMQHLLTTLQDTQSAGEVMSSIPMDDSLRRALMQMLASNGGAVPPMPQPPPPPLSARGDSGMLRSPSDSLRLSPHHPMTPDSTHGGLRGPALTPPPMSSRGDPQGGTPYTQRYHVTPPPAHLMPMRGVCHYERSPYHMHTPSATPRDSTPRTPHGHHPFSTPRAAHRHLTPPPLLSPPSLSEHSGNLSLSERLTGPPSSREKTFTLNSLPEDSEDRAASAPLPHGAGTGVFIPGVYRGAPPARPARTPRSGGHRSQISAPLLDTPSVHTDLEPQSFDRHSLSSELPRSQTRGAARGAARGPRAAMTPTRRTPRPANPATPPWRTGASVFAPDTTDNSDESGALSSASTGPLARLAAAKAPSTPPAAASPRVRRGGRAGRAPRATALSAPIPESPAREIVENSSLSASISPGSRNAGCFAPAARLPECDEVPPTPRGARLQTPRLAVPAAAESLPLAVTQWSQDHTSVSMFLALDRFNPASLMVQIQQHMVVVMALNSGGPSHVLKLRPEHAVRVQGSKSNPQPGSGIHLVLQKRSPGTTWVTYGQSLT